MDPKLSETPQDSEISEVSPLLLDDGCAIDPTLYAIGGEDEFAKKPIYGIIVDDMDQLKVILHEREGYVNIEDFNSHQPEVEIKSGQQISSVESLQEHEIVLKKVIGTLFSAWLKFAPRSFAKPECQDSEMFSPRAQHAMFLMWRVIKTKTDTLPESDVIVQGLSKYIVDYMHRLQLVRPEGAKYVLHENFEERVTDIVRKRWKQILVDDSIYQNDINSIVETLFSAWLQYPPSKPDDPVGENYELLSLNALNAMANVWRQIIAERDFFPNSKEIVQGLVATMVDYMYQSQLTVPEHIKEKDLKVYVTDIVRVGWQKILDQIEEKEGVRKKRERRKINRERWRKRREIEEVLSFYEPLSRMKFEAPLDCKLCCIFLCVCFSAFFFQVLIHTLLLAWPLSIGIMGGIYMTQCPMNYLMPYMMMAAGATGTLAILLRLSYVFYEKFSGNEINILCPWILLKVIEYALLAFLIIHLYCFYSTTPSFDLGSAKYCNKTFYVFVYYINYASIGIASVWLLVYFIKLIIWFQIRKFPLRPRW